MAVLKDVFCVECGNGRTEMVDADAISIESFCTPCWQKTEHTSHCTGGQKLKCYAGTYDGRDWSGDMEFCGIEATYEDGTPVMEANGVRTDEKYRSNFDARMDEKRKKKKFEHEQATGSGPLHFHN